MHSIVFVVQDIEHLQAISCKLEVFCKTFATYALLVLMYYSNLPYQRDVISSPLYVEGILTV